MEWNGKQVTLFGSAIGRNGMELFYNNITIPPLILKKLYKELKKKKAQENNKIEIYEV